MKKITYLFLCSLLSFAFPLKGQSVIIDQMVSAGGLNCFPVQGDSLSYMYLPARARLAEDENGKPRFSFLRYAQTQTDQTDSNQGKTITEAAGGGILHFLITYDTPAEQIEQAQAELKRMLRNQDVTLKGPIVFDEGKYFLISSILNPKTNQEERTLLTSGSAPIFENQQIALAFSLTPEEASLLQESFKMTTPDISVSFEMTFTGLSQPYFATLVVDFEKMRKMENIQQKTGALFFKKEVNKTLDSLRTSGVINLTVIGENANLDGLLNTAYEKLTKLMFEPVPPFKVAKKNLVDQIADYLLPSNILMNQLNLGFSNGYQMKSFHETGNYHLAFNGRTYIQRTSLMTANIGDLYQRYGDDTTMFKDVLLDDPFFKQREIFVGIDGAIKNDFGDLVNSVTVQMRKQHQGGHTSTGEVILLPGQAEKLQEPINMVYGYDGDTDRGKWLSYEYQTIYKLQGGATYQTPWREESAAMINLHTPYHKWEVAIGGDLDYIFKEKGARMVQVVVSYPFFEQTRTERKVIRPSSDLDDMSFFITLPNEFNEVEYQVIWRMSDGQKLIAKGVDDTGVIFIDEFPKE